MNRDAFYVPRWQESSAPSQQQQNQQKQPPPQSSSSFGNAFMAPLEGVVDSVRSTSSAVAPPSQHQQQQQQQGNYSPFPTPARALPADDRRMSVSTAPFGALRSVPGSYRGPLGADTVLAPMQQQASFGVIDPPPYSTPSSVSFSPDEPASRIGQHRQQDPPASSFFHGERNALRSPNRRGARQAAFDQPQSGLSAQAAAERARNLGGNFLQGGRSDASEHIKAAVEAASASFPQLPVSFTRGAMDGVNLDQPWSGRGSAHRQPTPLQQQQSTTQRAAASRLQAFRDRQNREMKQQQLQPQDQQQVPSSSSQRFTSNNRGSSGRIEADGSSDPASIVDEQDELDLLLFACSAQEAEQHKLQSIRKQQQQQQHAAKRNGRGGFRSSGSDDDGGEYQRQSGEDDDYDDDDDDQNLQTRQQQTELPSAPLTEQDAMLFQRLMQRKVLWVRRAQHSLYDWATRLQAYEQALTEREARLADAETQRAAAYQERLVALTEAETSFRRAANEQQKQLARLQQHQAHASALGATAPSDHLVGGRGDFSLSARINVANNYLRGNSSTSSSIMASLSSSSAAFNGIHNGSGPSSASYSDPMTVIAIDLSPMRSDPSAGNALSGGGVAKAADGKPAKSALRAPSYALSDATSTASASAGAAKRAGFVNF